MNELTQIISNTKLSETQKGVLRSFMENPYSREFLLAAKVLLELGYKQEAFEALYEGVRRHPDYTAARVLLCQELFVNGMFKEAWSTLESTPVSLRHNKAAEILRFKLSIILGYIDHYFASAGFLKHDGFDDEFLEVTYSKVSSSSFNEARDWFLDEVSSRYNIIIDDKLRSDTVSEFIAEDIDQDLSRQEKEELNRRKITSFFVSSLDEVFGREKHKNISDVESDQLDTLTYADVLMKQGNYVKAEKLYKQLQYMSPHNDLYKIRLKQLESLKNEQSNVEVEIDNQVREKLLEVELLDQKILILDKLLDRLNYGEKVA